jgi:hypothetical protein
MNKKKSFLLYDDSYETLQYLSDEQLGRLTRMIFDYRINGVVCDVSDPLFFCFNPIRVQLERNEIKYIDEVEKRSIAGKASAEARANKRQQDSTHVESVQHNEQVSTNPTDSVSDSVSDSDSVNDILNTAKADKSNFKKWTSLEFAEDIKKHKENYDKDMLLAFYEYWVEKDNNGKMLFQFKKTWQTNLRLDRWKRTNNSSSNLSFEKNKNGAAASPNTFSRASNGLQIK